jgi:hypothetical protein
MDVRLPAQLHQPQRHGGATKCSFGYCMQNTLKPLNGVLFTYASPSIQPTEIIQIVENRAVISNIELYQLLLIYGCIVHSDVGKEVNIVAAVEILQL